MAVLFYIILSNIIYHLIHSFIQITMRKGRKKGTLRAWRPKEVQAKEATKSQSLSHSSTLKLSWWMEAESESDTLCLCLCICLCFHLLMVITRKACVVMAKDSIFMIWVILLTIGFWRLQSVVADEEQRRQHHNSWSFEDYINSAWLVNVTSFRNQI